MDPTFYPFSGIAFPEISKEGGMVEIFNGYWLGHFYHSHNPLDQNISGPLAAQQHRGNQYLDSNPKNTNRL
jgi:hypothetical protein